MAEHQNRHPENVPGEFFNDDDCIHCGICPELAPMIFRESEEDGLSFVHRQPQTEQERDLALEALDACPTESIGQVPQ